ncbi:helix-turn-helix domain-containing protein [Actinomadura scrupuli]|uniref:helix-turn-helix domain-containing protein n=1 Tax=Actinomadura scrupuli TaxID=559629 RepID=UPI003D97A048
MAEAGRQLPFDDLASAAAVSPGAGPTVLRVVLGAQLRRLREARGLTREDAGYAIRGSGSKISRMELGRVSFKERDVAELLNHYGVVHEEHRETLLALARQSHIPGWWHRYSDVLPSWFEVYVGLEEAASLIRSYEVQFVHGLLQTEDYARAVVKLAHASAPEEEIERRVHLRMRRQRLLTRPHAPTLWFVLDEAVLLRSLGGREAMRSQLEHLLEISALPNVSLQVIPFSATHLAVVGCPFAILRFAQPDLPDMVYLEQVTSALYLDRRDDVETYARIMDGLVVAAHSPEATREMLAGILART